jgi:hypothetical protein
MRKDELDGEQVFVIHDFLTPGECEHYVRLTEDAGYRAAPITGRFGPVLAPDVRNNQRVMIDRPDWAAALWERARPLVPSPFPTAHPPGLAETDRVAPCPAVGLNERFRFYRYDAGQTFRPHADGHFARGDERSRLTFMVYLGGDCEGGETVIYFQDDGLTRRGEWEVRVAPAAGKALVFYHYLLHEGAAVTAGRKYVLRTDVMYRVGRGG